MKQQFCILALFALLAGSFYSCDDSKTYAEELADEDASIESFMKLRGYTVTNVIPTVVPWPDSVFYRTESGLFIHVLDTGSQVIDTIPEGRPICVRYKEYYMTDSAGYSNMYGSGLPSVILYNKVSSSATYEDCKAWHEALDYVGDGGHVYIISRSDIGWSAYSSDVMAAFYELKFTFWENNTSDDK